MTSYLLVTSFTVPAGTTQAAPLTASVVLLDEQLVTVRVVIAPGHAGLTGLRITSGGTQVVPYVAGSWLSGDDETIDYPWDAEVTANGLALAGYNTDQWDHTFTLRWTLTDLPAAGSPVVIESPQAAAAPAAADTAAVQDLAGALTPDQITALADVSDLAAAP